MNLSGRCLWRSVSLAASITGASRLKEATEAEPSRVNHPVMWHGCNSHTDVSFQGPYKAIEAFLHALIEFR
jgi:hypothetical protein